MENESGDESSLTLPSNWDLLPEHLLINIFYHYLTPREILLNAGLTCKRWQEISVDNFLWNKLFHRNFNVHRDIGIKPGAESWFLEYKRLLYHTPHALTEILIDHGDRVLHVSFSHNGKMFATCSKDGYVLIWNSEYPASLKYSHDIKRFSWQSTLYSQFNETDTLLLVSGTHFGNSTSGEIAVFSVEGESHLRCRVGNRPYDLFGTWFSDQYLISGDLHWLDHLISTSILSLTKADQEISSESVPIMKPLYRFYNRNASAIRSIVIANCPWLSCKDSQVEMKQTESLECDLEEEDYNYEYDLDVTYQKLCELFKAPNTIYYRDEYREKMYKQIELNKLNFTSDSESSSEEDEAESTLQDSVNELENITPKYLIFTTGVKTCMPHLIGIKRIDKVYFPKKLDRGLSLKDRLEIQRREREQQEPEPDWRDYESVADRFDKIDKVIDFHGRVIGMCLSPDHRFLYVNCRSWPENCIISDPLEPPPIAQQIDIHVIDLETMDTVGILQRAHKAYTSSSDSFYIYLDVSDDYVASGAEDCHAYTWDRFYGHCIAQYQHSDAVSSVAFNPKDREMMVTTSDDHKIKIWRSKSNIKSLNAEVLGYSTQFKRS